MGYVSCVNARGAQDTDYRRRDIIGHVQCDMVPGDQRTITAKGASK
jgi:hypothetical protein